MIGVIVDGLEEPPGAERRRVSPAVGSARRSGASEATGGSPEVAGTSGGAVAGRSRCQELIRAQVILLSVLHRRSRERCWRLPLQGDQADPKGGGRQYEAQDVQQYAQELLVAHGYRPAGWQSVPRRKAGRQKCDRHRSQNDARRHPGHTRRKNINAYRHSVSEFGTRLYARWWR